jgi:hypothetical protein
MVSAVPPQLGVRVMQILIPLVVGGDPFGGWRIYSVREQQPSAEPTTIQFFPQTDIQKQINPNVSCTHPGHVRVRAMAIQSDAPRA